LSPNKQRFFFFRVNSPIFLSPIMSRVNNNVARSVKSRLPTSETAVQTLLLQVNGPLGASSAAAQGLLAPVSQAQPEPRTSVRHFSPAKAPPLIVKISRRESHSLEGESLARRKPRTQRDATQRAIATDAPRGTRRDWRVRFDSDAPPTDTPPTDTPRVTRRD
jgi:hypothetical protein